MLWSSSESFSYSSLPPVSSDLVLPSDREYDEHRIRVVKLARPSLRNKVLQCDMQTMSIPLGGHNEMGFRALSYVHGSDVNTREIRVNGRRFAITNNLYDCLEELSKDRKRWGSLWIDQLCIDNSNNMERNRQVKHMGEVYRQAEEVVVWLGKGLASDMVAIDLILRLHSEEDREQEEGAGATITTDELDLMHSFIKNPYFDRLWAVQELVLGRKIILLVGSREIDWEVLVKVCKRHIFSSLPSGLRDVTDDCTSLQRISMARIQRDVLDMFDVINGFCRYNCSDPRDHLFGLLGLLGNNANMDNLSLTVDYSLSLEALFLTFCYEMLQIMPETDQLFDLLVVLAHAMGFEGVFYGGCQEDEVLEFFRGAGARGGSHVKATIRNTLQAKTVPFQEAATFLAMGVRAQYDMLSGKRIF